MANPKPHLGKPHYSGNAGPGSSSGGSSGGGSSGGSSGGGSSSSSTTSSSSSGSSGGGSRNRPGRPLAPGQTPIAPTRTTSGESVSVTSSGVLMSGGGSLTPGGGVFQYRGTGGGGGGGSNPNANFLTVDGREVFVEPSGREANFNRRDGQAVYVAPPIAPRSGRDYQGRSSTDFSSDIRRAQPVNQLSEASRRGAAENIVSNAENRISTVNRAFGGASDVFGWVPGLGGDNMVGKFGRAALAAPFTLLTAPAVVLYGGVVKLKTAEAVSSVYPEAIPSIRAESNRAFFRAPAEAGSMTKDLFTTPEGLGTVVGGGVLLGGLNTRSPSAPSVAPRGSIFVEFKAKVMGTTEGNAVAPPVAPRGTLTMTYKGRPSGFVNRLLGREADVAVRVGPRGDVSQVVKIGVNEYRTTQRAGASYSRTRVFKDGRATGMFEGAPLKVGDARATILDVIARETKSSSKNVKPDVLVQGVKAGRLVDVEVPVSGGVLRGSVVQESRGGALSRVERGRGSVTGLNLESRPVVNKVSTTVLDSELLSAQVFFTPLKRAYGQYNPAMIFEVPKGQGIRIRGQGSRDVRLRWNSGGRILIDESLVQKGFRDSTESYRQYRDTLAHERGHAFAFAKGDYAGDVLMLKLMKESPKKIEIKRGEFQKLKDSGMIQGDSFYDSYAPANRRAEMLTEMFKARELYPDSFKTVAPEWNKVFDKLDKKNVVEFIEPGTKTTIVGEPFFKETSLKETLQVGTPEEVARFERQASENRLSIGKGELIIDEKGVRRPSQLGIIAKERGEVKTSFEFDVTTRGTFEFVKRPGVVSRVRSRLTKNLDTSGELGVVPRGRPASRGAAERDWARVLRSVGVSERRAPRGRSRAASEPRGPDVAGLSDLRELEKLGAGNRARGGRSLNVDPETGLPEFSGGRQVLEPPRGRSRGGPSEPLPLENVARPVGRSQPVFASEMFREVRVSASRPRALYGFPVVSQRSLLGSSVIAGTKPSLVPEQRITPEQIIAPDVVVDTPERFWPVQSQSFQPFEPFVPSGSFAPIEGPPSGFVPPAFALPFGGGGSFGFPSSSKGNQRFKNAYSPSITGGLFNVKGSRRQANIATITGLGVRPMQLS